MTAWHYSSHTIINTVYIQYCIYCIYTVYIPVYTAGTVFMVIKEGTVVSGFYGLWI